jgi:hypothetical protein
MNLSPERFIQPLVTDRPGMRWWWQTPVPPVELVRELRAIAAAGFGEVEIAFSPGFWADDAQCAALTAVLEAANGLGVGVAMTLGAAWPLQTPNTTRGTAHAALELQYGVRYVEGVPARPVMLPRPFDDPEEERPTQLLAVVTARVLRKGGAPTIKTVQEPWGSKPRLSGRQSRPSWRPRHFPT